MAAPVYSIAESARLVAAATLFDELGVSALPVVDVSSRLTGLISRADLIRAGRLRVSSRRGEPLLWLPDKPVVEFMRTSVPVVRPDLPLWSCAARMVDQSTSRLYVAEDGPLEGVISTREMMRAVARAGVSTPLGQLAKPSVSLVSTEPVSVAAAHLSSTDEAFLVITSGGSPTGVFSRVEALASLHGSPAEPVESWMDVSVVVLDMATPMCQAADAALKSNCRYIIASDARSVSHVISGLDFARLVSGNPS